MNKEDTLKYNDIAAKIISILNSTFLINGQNKTSFDHQKLANKYQDIVVKYLDTSIELGNPLRDMAYKIVHGSASMINKTYLLDKEVTTINQDTAINDIVNVFNLA